MAYVQIKYKTGTVRNVPSFIAKGLVKRGLAEYWQEEAPKDEPIALVEEVRHNLPEIVDSEQPEYPPVEQPEEKTIDDLTKKEILEMLKERGIKAHHAAGIEKLRALLK